jgi:hypothetical protein
VTFSDDCHFKENAWNFDNFEALVIRVQPNWLATIADVWVLNLECDGLNQGGMGVCV